MPSIYVVFTSTPYKIGKIIRKVTHYHYNHVSVALDSELTTMYSFSRHHKNAPFYGGFNCESLLRYKIKDVVSDALICAVPLSSEEYEAVIAFIDGVKRDSSSYIYNMAAAATAPLSKNVYVDKAYTCVGFAEKLLRLCPSVKLPDGFCSIEALAAVLYPYAVFEGSLDEKIRLSTWSTDSFPNELSLKKAFCLTAKNNFELCKRIIKK